MSSITIQPLTFPEDSKVNFGAVASNADIQNLTGKEGFVKFALI